MSQNEIKEALEVIKDGGLIIYNTDSVPALGCDATNEEAVKKLLKLTQRKEGYGLVILASGMDMVARYVKEIPPIALEVAEVSVTPLTIIYPNGVSLASGVLGEDGSVAIRIPDNTFCLTLLRRFNKPIVATIPVKGSSAGVIRICLEEIEDHIYNNVDWVTEDLDSPESTFSVSSIISLGSGSQVKIIRK